MRPVRVVALVLASAALVASPSRARAQLAKVNFSRALESVAELAPVRQKLEARLRELQAEIDRAPRDQRAKLQERLQKELDEAVRRERGVVEARLLDTIRSLGDRDGWRAIVEVTAGKDVLARTGGAGAVDLTDAVIAAHDAAHPVPGRGPATPPPRVAPARRTPFIHADLARAVEGTAEWKALLADLRLARAEEKARLAAERVLLEKVRAAAEDGSVPILRVRAFLERRLLPRPDKYFTDRDRVDLLLALWSRRLDRDEPSDELPRAALKRAKEIGVALGAELEAEGARRGALWASRGALAYARPEDDVTTALLQRHDATHTPKPTRAKKAEPTPLAFVQPGAFLRLARELRLPVRDQPSSREEEDGRGRLAVIADGDALVREADALPTADNLFGHAMASVDDDEPYVAPEEFPFCWLEPRQRSGTIEYATLVPGRLEVKGVTAEHDPLTSDAVTQVTLSVDHPAVTAVVCVDTQSSTGMSIGTFAAVGGDLLRLEGFSARQPVWPP